MAGANPESEQETAGRRVGEFADVCSSERLFQAWYEASLPRVYGYVQGRTAGNSELAEDITQQAFTAAVRSRRTFDGHSEAVVWVCSIARNALLDHYRRVARDERRHLSLVVREIAVDGDARAWTRLDERDEVLAALRAISTDQRTAILLHYLDGLPVRDVARSLGRSEASVESLLSRSRERLRGLLEERR